MPSEKKKNVLPSPPGLDFVTPPHDPLVDDLRYALEHAKELFADIAWDFTLASKPTIIYAHKAILYARSSRSFQDRFLKNKDVNGISTRSISIKTDADPFFFRQELKFFYTCEEGSQEFLAAVDTTDELEQEKLKEDLLYMLKSKLYTDVELLLSISEDALEVSSEEDCAPTSYRAHRFMLASRSEYFKTMLHSQFVDSRATTIHLDAKIFTSTSLNLILTFIYTGILSSPSEPLTLETCEMVWVGADYLGIGSLCDECVHRIATKVHLFACTCTDCLAVVPRVASFAREHDVETLWKGCLHVLTKGFECMWPQKAFADLSDDLREEVLFALMDTIEHKDIVSMFKSCRKIFATIEVKGIGLPWIEAIRTMTYRIRSHTANLLVENFQQLCEENDEFLECVDGVGFSSDLLEDIMNIVVEEGLTEQNAGTVLNCITSNLLTRDAVADAQSLETKRVLLHAKQNVYNFIKKRWIGVKQSGGFRGLKDWLLEEFAKDLGVSVKELTDTSEQKLKPRTPNSTNGIRANGRQPSPSPTTKRTSASTKSNSSQTSVAGKTPSRAATNGTTNDSSTAKSGKIVRIATTTSTMGRPTRASILRQKALADAKNPVKSRTKTAPSRISHGTNANGTKSTDTTASSSNAGTTTPNRTSSSSLSVPRTESPRQRGRNTVKQLPSAASSRASSISSVHSSKSPSVSPSRFGGVRQTRASMLRQLKYDEKEQRRGRNRERASRSPGSSRASSIASVSSIASSTASSSVAHHSKRTPSQYSSSTTMTSASTGSISSLKPKPQQTKLSTTKDPDISVGRRVILPTKNNAPGTIQFLGETEFAKGVWVGVELDNPVGKNNGTVANIKYFETTSNQGIFVRPDSILII